jgi:hypothetical protein
MSMIVPILVESSLDSSKLAEHSIAVHLNATIAVADA